MEHPKEKRAEILSDLQQPVSIEKTIIQLERLGKLLDQAPAIICILAGPDFRYEFVNEAYQQLVPGRNLIGRPFADVFPEIKGTGIESIIHRVYQTGKTYYGKEVLFPVSRLENERAEDAWFNFIYQARYTIPGKIDGVSVFAFEVTDEVAAKLQAEESVRSLKSLVMTAHYGLLILRGRNWIVETVNTRITELWAKDQEEVLGKPLLEIFPDLEEQPFPAYLRQVYDTGIGYGQDEEVYYVETPAGRVTKYISFYYDPIFDKDGNVSGIIASAEDISEKVEGRLLLEKSYSEQKSLVAELIMINEELERVNERLVATNQLAQESQLRLEKTITDLAISEVRFKQMVDQAPVAISILKGPDLIIDSANELILKRWGKGPGILNMPLRLALPELKGQPFLKLLETVYRSGKLYIGHEVKAMLGAPGALQEYYLDFVYKPLKDKQNRTTAVMVVATDVTLQVKAKKEGQKTIDMLKFSIEAANIGTWAQDLKTNAVTISGRHKEMFGFTPDEHVPTENLMNQILPEFRIEVYKAMEHVYQYGGLYDITYPTVGFHDKKMRWTRALGSVIKDEDGVPSFFSGVSIETTQQMEDEMRKNHFINIVSHELKTPLTSLKGYIQLLQHKSEKSGDLFMASTLGKADSRLDKMTSLINGFLNVSQLESGKIQLNIQEFDLGLLITEVAEEISLQASMENIRFSPVQPVMIKADRDKIGQVIINLLNNASKYSPLASLIDISSTLENETVVVRITDCGIGIRQEDQRRIFDRYYRVDSTENNQISGFGIGLYICYEIMQRHNGSLYVESSTVNGSTFCFSLPLD